MLERAARAVDDETYGELTDLRCAAIARAVLMAVREPGDEFMLRLYPDPKVEVADRGRSAGERSRRAGRMQVAHFVDAILSGDA